MSYNQILCLAFWRTDMLFYRPKLYNWRSRYTKSWEALLKDLGTVVAPMEGSPLKHLIFLFVILKMLIDWIFRRWCDGLIYQKWQETKGFYRFEKWWNLHNCWQIWLRRGTSTTTKVLKIQIYLNSNLLFFIN